MNKQQSTIPDAQSPYTVCTLDPDALLLLEYL